MGGRPAYGHPSVGQRLHHAPQILTADRIDTDTRFIEQQDSRPGHQCAGETQLLLHAAGELARQASGKGGKTCEVEQLGEQVGVSIGGHTAQLRSEERRVGKEGVSTGRSRWSTYNSKKKTGKKTSN